jgi:hypothetical protein
MAVPDSNQGQVVQVGSGPNYEVWQAPTGVLRLDWNRLGIVAATVVGHGHADFGLQSTRRWDTAIRAGTKITILVDFWEMLTYDSGVRTSMTNWSLAHRASIASVHVLTRSKLVAMGVAVGNLALGGLLKPYSTRASFDVLLKSHGLPVNPAMPKPSNAS